MDRKTAPFPGLNHIPFLQNDFIIRYSAMAGLDDSLTEELIRYYWIKQWDGKLPTTVLGGDASYMIDLTE